MSLLTTATLVVTPNANKTGKLYSVIPSNGNGDFSVTRATTATRTNSAGLIEVVPYNLFQYSEQFDSTAWAKNALSITPNTTIAPNGTLTADTLSVGVDASSVRHRLITNSIGSQVVGTIYTGTYYLKANQHQWIQILGNIGYSVGVWANFDLINGVIGNTGGVDTTASIESVGNGWYRCRVSGLATATSTTGFEIITTNNTNSGRYPSYQSLVAEDVCYIWGAQLVEGTDPLTYLRTETRLNIPRLDYSLGSCPNLLLEPQRTNLALQSNTLSTSPNVLEGSTATANIYISPDGTQNAMRFTETTVNDLHGFYQYNTVSAQTYTASVWTKQTGRRYISFYSDFTGTAISSFFDLQTKSVLSSGSGHTCSIQDFGNGWFRLIVTLTATAGSRFVYWGGSNNGSSVSYAGSTSISQTFYGYQLEAGAYATSYIPTTTASVTRNADIVNKTGISSLIGQTEGVIYWEGISTIQTDILGTNRSTVNGIYITKGSGNLFRIFIYNSSNVITLTDTIIRNSNTKIAISYKSGNTSLFVNGVKVATSSDSLTFNASLDAIRLNDDYLIGAGTYFTKSVLVYKTALTDTQLTQLTTL